MCRSGQRSCQFQRMHQNACLRLRVCADLSRRDRAHNRSCSTHRWLRVSVSCPGGLRNGIARSSHQGGSGIKGSACTRSNGQVNGSKSIEPGSIRTDCGRLDGAAGASARRRTSGTASGAAAATKSSSGGLDELINQFKQNGLEGVINSWIGTGQNQAISPTQLRQALGQKTVGDLSRQAGAPPDDLLSQLSKYLPAVIDRLTPNGQLPRQTDLRSEQ